MTTTQPTPSAQLSEFLSRFPAETAALATKCLPKLRRRCPGTTELVYDYGKSLVVSFTPSGKGYEGVVAVAVDARGVKLYVPKDVPDPKGLLEGAGSKVRSVPVRAASDLDRGGVHDLIVAAIAHSGISLPATGSTTIVIRSSAKKTSPEKKGSPARKPARPAAKRNAKRASS